MDINSTNDVVMAEGTQEAADSHVEASFGTNPLQYDLGNLLVIDSNPVRQNPSEIEIHARAQNCAQAIINQLLTTCPIHTREDKSVYIELPPPTTPIPRAKPLPKPKEKTKWEKFAEKKGISSKKDSRKETGGKVYDPASGEWVPKYGYRGKNKDGENEWIVEVDDAEKEEAGIAEGRSIRGDGRRERKDRVRRQQRKERNNDRKSRKSDEVDMG